MTQPIIEAKHLALGYANTTIVDEIQVSIDAGEFIGILGPNGSGKSTFLKALLGLTQIQRGDIFVLGNKPSKGAMQVGYMPQIRSDVAIANFTSRAFLEASFEGIRFGLPLPSQARTKAIEQAIQMVKAKTYIDRPFSQLSGGERQRIFLAQALLGHPKILLLDEPLANLDPYYQEMFVQLLEEVRQQLNVTILLTAHDPNPLLPVMQRVLYFAKGKGIIGPTQQVITSQTLSALYGTRIEVVTVKQRLFVLGEGQAIHAQEEPHHHA